MRVANIVAVVVAACGAFLACADDEPPPQRCNGIPAGGCPLSHGVACEDPACEAVYACREGNVWELQQRCPPHPDAGHDAMVVDATSETGPGLDASIDAPEGAYGGPGCGPLQPPDCSAGFALSCPAANGCCDCEDVYVCRNGGWEAWGTCSADAGVKPF